MGSIECDGIILLICLYLCTVCVYVFGRGIISCHIYKCHHVAAMYTCVMQCTSLSHTYTPLCTTVLTNTHLCTPLVTLWTCYTGKGVLCVVV